MWWVVLVPVAYLLGTFPSAEIVASAAGIDITSTGSGNPGASNVTRALGWRKGALVFALDAAKGFAATAIGLLLGGRPGGYVFGAAAILGHIYPATRHWRGGKGVATGGGVIAALHPVVAVAVVAMWLALSRLTGKAAVASIAAVAAAPVGLGLAGAPPWEILATAGLCGLVVARHRSNIGRMMRREEHALARSPRDVER
jgi:acyl phosphate:glycerol-3-phosphate acyltransferase